MFLYKRLRDLTWILGGIFICWLITLLLNKSINYLTFFIIGAIGEVTNLAIWLNKKDKVI